MRRACSISGNANRRWELELGSVWLARWPWLRATAFVARRGNASRTTYLRAIFATRVTETIFGEMIYHISGSGDPVVFLHGIYLGASSYEWSKVYPHFTFGREVIVPDLIGFGESESPG